MLPVTLLRARHAMRAGLMALVVAPVGSLAASPPPSGGGLAGAQLFVLESPGRRIAASWRGSRPADAALLERVASQPVAKWLAGWTRDVRAEARAVGQAAMRAGRTPVFVAYNIPHRDCGSHSAGGVANARAYGSWIRQLASGIVRGSVVILEPDALAGMDCLDAARQSERVSMLADAVWVLKQAGAIVYLDGGHARWHGAGTMAARLKRAGIAEADGFALNVSNFVSTAENTRYGEQVSAQTGGKHFVIDTSRNGLGPAAGNAWCNPRGRALGQFPTTDTRHRLVDALLWVKVPGESDGRCNGGPAAGEWWPEYALELARNQSATLASAQQRTRAD